MLNRDEYDRMITQLADQAWRRGDAPVRVILRGVNWLIFGGFVAAMVGLSAVLWVGQENLIIPATVAFVLVGWVFSLCLHEFAHAATAFLGGDDSATTRRYLSFNPLLYINPLLSIILPLLFLLIGGIGLPGGAVYLQRGRIRSRAWQSAVSLAGPFSNLVFLGVLAVAYRITVQTAHIYVPLAVAALALFQAFAIILNLLPLPPLDGFQALMYWLPTRWRLSPWASGSYGIFILFLALWYIPVVGELFSNVVFRLLSLVGIEGFAAQLGLSLLFFWKR
ncbi:MAG: site-2 protease family protein [Ktedonobacterales bacterium]|nr:site-2 protease family protein [Ktedonobacterales bacterium]